MPRISKEDKQRADKAIRKILIDVKIPTEGYTVREMVRMIWSKDELYGEGFYTFAKLVERRIGAVRHSVYKDIREQMREKAKSANPVTGKKLPKPEFLPYALPTGAEDRYWKYFNAVEHSMMPHVVDKLRRKAGGMNANAEILDSVF